MQTIGEYDLFFLGNKNLGMGFIVRNDLNYKIVDDKSKRICVIKIEKKSELASTHGLQRVGHQTIL